MLVDDLPALSTLTILTVDDSNIGSYTCVANNTERAVVNEDTAYIEVVGTCV